MRKLIAASLAALSLVAVTPGVSAARPSGGFGGHGYYGHGGGYYGGHGYGGRYYGGRGYGDAWAAGIAGLAVGAIVGSALADRDDYYYGPPAGYYGPGYSYYGQGYGYYPPEQCYTRELVWDPRLRRNVEITHPC